MPSPRVWPRQCRAGEGRRAGVSLEAVVAAVAVLIAFGGSIIVVACANPDPDGAGALSIRPRPVFGR